LAGVQIADILSLPEASNQAFRHDVQSTLERIGSVHVVSGLPHFGIVFTDRERYGGYKPETEETPRHLELSIRSATPRLTTAHEIGHFLDDAVGGFVVFASMEIGSSIHKVVQVARRSYAIRQMEEFRLQSEGIISPARLQVLNRLEEVEIWARSYAQYIGMRSGDVQMMREVEYRRDIEMDVRRNEQWEWDDFAPIATAIDIAFRELGWRP
jgi:hypothetical protein